MNEFVFGSIGGVLSYIILNYILKPVTEYKKIRREVFKKLTFYADKYSHHLEITGSIILTSTVFGDPSPEEQNEYEEAKTELRRLFSELESFSKEISFYKWLSFINFLPKEKLLKEVSGKILAISNRLIISRGSAEGINIDMLNIEDAEKIKELL